MRFMTRRVSREGGGGELLTKCVASPRRRCVEQTPLLRTIIPTHDVSSQQCLVHIIEAICNPETRQVFFQLHRKGVDKGYNQMKGILLYVVGKQSNKVWYS